MAVPKTTSAERAAIDQLVKEFLSHVDSFQLLIDNLEREILAKKDLAKLIHSIRKRVKDSTHLRDKLTRKTIESKIKGASLGITSANLFARINDLAGLRILHLHTEQFAQIDSELRGLLRDRSYRLVERPAARTWDDESRRYFTSIGIRTIRSPSLYTSVHYVIQANTRVRYTCEIQVRTLMEEVWGEVDHTINYPHKTKSLACREQILALARSTSAASRLVDSIFRSDADFRTQ